VFGNLTEAADEFNSFLVNMGPSSAKEITNKPGDTGSGWKGENKVMQSMFPGGLSENQIISVAAKTKSQTSADSNGIDMKTVKMTVDCIIKALRYIYNLSFQTGIFPDRMKTAGVIPLFRSGDRQSFNS